MLAKREANLLAHPPKPTPRIDRVGVRELLAKARHRARQILIAREHGVQYIRGRQDVGACRVTLLVFALAVEANRGCRIARFHRVKDLHGVDNGRAFEREDVARAFELFVQGSGHERRSA
jgi:hypothetical protein